MTGQTNCKQCCEKNMQSIQKIHLSGSNIFSFLIQPYWWLMAESAVFMFVISQCIFYVRFSTLSMLERREMWWKRSRRRTGSKQFQEGHNTAQFSQLQSSKKMCRWSTLQFLIIFIHHFPLSTFYHFSAPSSLPSIHWQSALHIPIQYYHHLMWMWWKLDIIVYCISNVVLRRRDERDVRWKLRLEFIKKKLFSNQTWAVWCWGQEMEHTFQRAVDKWECRQDCNLLSSLSCVCWVSLHLSSCQQCFAYKLILCFTVDSVFYTNSSVQSALSVYLSD